jgi:trimethylamine--corrinoid protein Co-methyltransferase
MSDVHLSRRSIDRVLFRHLSNQACKSLHEASLEILHRTGVKLHHPEAVDLLASAGASVEDNDRVHVPADLIEQALSTAPKSVAMYDRVGRPAMRLEGDRCYYGPGSDCLNVIDHRTREHRRATLQDVRDGAVVCDGLDHVDFVMSMFLPSDIDPGVSDLHQMEVMLNHTTKPIIFVTNDFANCARVVEMAEAVVGGSEALAAKPFCACYINVTTAMRHNEEALEKLLFLAEKGVPALYIPIVIAGMTSPATMAGSMAALNAGVLTGLVLSQLKRPGAPFVVPGCGLTMLDMKTMVNPYCSPDAKGVTHAMGHYYGLPIFGLGGVSEAKLVDQQAAAEAALTLMVETLNGANLIHDLGYLESGLCGSLAQLAICDEIVGWLDHLIRPLEINDETLALDLIHEQGPEGHYIETDHTMAHFRELWYPDLFERADYGEWQAQGSKSLGARAVERVEEILAKHEPTPLPEDAAREVRAIVQRAAAGDASAINHQ